MKELTNLRTSHIKHYDLEDGKGTRRLVARLNPQHYDNNGNWEDIDCNIEDGKVTKVTYNAEIYKDKIGYSGTDPEGKKMEIEIKSSVDSLSAEKPMPYKAPKIEGNTATYENVDTDTDIKIIFLPSMIKVKRIVKSANAPKTIKIRSYRESGMKGKLLNLGADAKGNITELKVTEENSARKDEKTITQEWTGKVRKINTTTRKRELSDDITYPVEID